MTHFIPNCTVLATYMPHTQVNYCAHFVGIVLSSPRRWYWSHGFQNESGGLDLQGSQYIYTVAGLREGMT